MICRTGDLLRNVLSSSELCGGLSLLYFGCIVMLLQSSSARVGEAANDEEFPTIWHRRLSRDCRRVGMYLPEPYQMALRKCTEKF